MAYDSNPVSRLKSKLEDEISEKLGNLGEHVSPDYPSYVGKVNYIKGLRFAVEQCEQAEKIYETASPEAPQPLVKRRYED